MTFTFHSYPEYFQATLDGRKTHELRAESDTAGIGFALGDIFYLREFDPVRNAYTGRECSVEVTYLSPSPKPWLVPGYRLMSIRLRKPWWRFLS